MRRLTNKYLYILVAILFSSCELQHEYGDFPMQEFVDYLPVQINDTIWYSEYNQKKLLTDIPFVVQKKQIYYNEGSTSTYNQEYAEYYVEADAIERFGNNTDTISLTVSFQCFGRTRIRVDFSATHSLSYTSTFGLYNYANKSDILFDSFPQDSIMLTESEGDNVVAKITRDEGLSYFFCGPFLYQIKANL